MGRKQGKPLNFFEDKPALQSSDVAEVLRAIFRKYRLRDGDLMNQVIIFSHLRRLALAIGALDEGTHSLNKRLFEGLKVLDLACGSEAAFDRSQMPAEAARNMEPWLCRIAAHLRAQVVGVDWKYPRYRTTVGDNDKDGLTEREWAFVKKDLRETHALDRGTFPDGSQDVVSCVAFMLYDDLRMDTASMQAIRSTDPDLYNTIARAIILQSRRILRDGGVLVLNESSFKKDGERLVPLRDFSERNRVQLDDLLRGA